MNPRYGFIGGLHRSGTSLFARCLAAHPATTSFEGTSVWEDEGQHLQDVLMPARLLGGPGRFARHAAAHLVERDPLETTTVRRRLLAAWEPLWAKSAPVRLAKSPPNLLRGRLLQQVFPGAALLVIRRHPLAVALATRRMGRRLRRLDLAELVEHWVIAHERFLEDRPHLDRPVLLEHADLVAHGHAALRPAFERLGLQPCLVPFAFEDTDAKYRSEWAGMIRTKSAASGLHTRLAGLATRVETLGYRLENFERDSTPVRTGFRTR